MDMLATDGWTLADATTFCTDNNGTSGDLAALETDEAGSCKDDTPDGIVLLCAATEGAEGKAYYVYAVEGFRLMTICESFMGGVISDPPYDAY